MADLTDSLPPSSATTPSSTSTHSRHLPIREDCWTEQATSTLVDAWGRRFLHLNRGNLRQKDWQDVADSVNSLHGLTKKTFRSDVQCKNRIDTVKKKYKTEKARVSASHGSFVSSWPFYSRLDELIGSAAVVSMKKPSNSVVPSSPPMALPLPYRKTVTPASVTPAVVAAAVSQKRSLSLVDESYFRRNYSAIAAAAAAEETEEEEEDEEEEEERVSDEEEGEGEGVSRLAKAIKRFGEVYEKVEAEKVRQMVELEKQRMQFAKDLEVQRMHMFMETQVQLERIKRGKKSTPSDI